MKCPACRAVYSNGLDVCPRCQTVAVVPNTDSDKSHFESVQREETLMTIEDTGCDATLAKPAPAPSTLIEFPGSGRAARPLWRKELSERVREIQERRSREAALEAQERQMQQEIELFEEGQTGTPLGLVPQPDQPALNPLVAAALKRIERAQHNPTPSHVRSSMRGASVAVARVAREHFDESQDIGAVLMPAPLVVPAPVKAPTESPVDNKRVHALSVVQSSSVPVESLLPAKTLSIEPAFGSSISQTFDNQDARILAPGEIYDDYAPVFTRLVAGLIDLCVVLFASSPFAAIIELTNGDWADERVTVSMCGIVLFVMFLYSTTSTSIGGRTWGMSLLSLRAVDVDTGLPPTTKQSVTRAFAYIGSLLVFGLGLLYALVDAEGRGVHDHLSDTTVVRE